MRQTGILLDNSDAGMNLTRICCISRRILLYGRRKRNEAGCALGPGEGKICTRCGRGLERLLPAFAGL